MTDPVDTDALRMLIKLEGAVESGKLREALGSAADEVDRLRTELAWMTEHAAQRASAYERARAVIENAPHFPGCEMFTVGGSWKCTCWKADAL